MEKAPRHPWRTLDRCPEGPPDIGRVHVDPYGNVLFCQGISVGNAWEKPLKTIRSDLDLDQHPIIGPLMRGGPAGLAKESRVRPKREYADACHLCYEVRRTLRKRHAADGILVPDQPYGVTPSEGRRPGARRRP